MIILNLNEAGSVPDYLYGHSIKSIGNVLLALFSNVNKIIVEEDTTYYDCKKEKRISVIYDIIKGYIHEKLWKRCFTIEEGFCLSYNDNLPSDTIEPLKKLKDAIDERVELCKQAALKEQWIAAGKCQYCGGDLSLFGKCKICGKRN